MQKYFYALVLFMFLSACNSCCAHNALDSECVVIDERVLFGTKRWKKPREAFVFLVKHQRELPYLTRVGIVLAYKKMRGETLSVARVLKEFKELERYKDEVYEFIALENPYEPAIEVLKELHALGKKVFFVTATLPESYEYNKQLFADVFALCDDVIFVSPSLGMYDMEYFSEVQNQVSKKTQNHLQKVLYLDAKKEKHALKNRNHAAKYGVRCISVEMLEKELP